MSSAHYTPQVRRFEILQRVRLPVQYSHCMVSHISRSNCIQFTKCAGSVATKALCHKHNGKMWLFIWGTRGCQGAYGAREAVQGPMIRFFALVPYSNLRPHLALRRNTCQSDRKGCPPMFMRTADACRAGSTHQASRSIL